MLPSGKWEPDWDELRSAVQAVIDAGEQFQAADLDSVQRAVTYTALETLRSYSIIALVIMFALSLLIGWWVAGRALRPLDGLFLDILRACFVPNPPLDIQPLLEECPVHDHQLGDLQHDRKGKTHLAL